MIKNEREYQEVITRIEQDKEVIKKQRESLDELGLNSEEINRALEPMLSFHQQLVEEVEWYERIKRQDIDAIASLTELGRLLIALRIATKLTQKELAKRLNVSEAQVSKDERNEYHGISVLRAHKILTALGARVKTEVELGYSSEPDKVAA